MPFKSKAQMRLLFAMKPKVANEFAQSSKQQGVNMNNLPQHVAGGQGPGGNNLVSNGNDPQSNADTAKKPASKGKGLPPALMAAVQARMQQKGN